jgi:hypothetical protein
VHGRHNGANQRWKILYLDKKDKIAKDGLNEQFGFYRNRPFYMISELSYGAYPFDRMMEMLGNT